MKVQHPYRWGSLSGALVLTVAGLGLGGCGSEGDTAVSTPPLITSLEIPASVNQGQAFPLAFSVTVPGGLPTSNAFQLSWGGFQVQTLSANQAGCGAGATSCSTAFGITPPSGLSIGEYAVTFRVFDRTGQAASVTRNVELAN
ncbi:MAG: hypothetical protein NW237_11795 [Cyanobacteriota bacterium]|nr:hypothetical protein [Cyanobacteriota bacterium]